MTPLNCALKLNNVLHRFQELERRSTTFILYRVPGREHYRSPIGSIYLESEVARIKRDIQLYGALFNEVNYPSLKAGA